jgi:hypothetical protein
MRRQPAAHDRYLRDDAFLEYRARMRKLCNPLVRFLRRQVGRKWSEVQQELEARCLALPVDRTLRDAVRQSMLGLVTGGHTWSKVRGRYYVDADSGGLGYRGQAAD